VLPVLLQPSSGRHPLPAGGAGKKWVDAAVDLPFALPTSVAGLTLTTVYSEEGLLGALLAHLGINVVFTKLGVAVAMIFVSFPFVVIQGWWWALGPPAPTCASHEQPAEPERAAWEAGGDAQHKQHGRGGTRSARRQRPRASAAIFSAKS
jgi:hypothetical protein